MPDTEYHVLLKGEERNSIPYPSYHGADMQNVKFCTQAYFQTNIFTREKYERPLINTSFMLIFLTTYYLPIILPQYIIQIVSVFSWFTLISPKLSKTFIYKCQNMEYLPQPQKIYTCAACILKVCQGVWVQWQTRKESKKK